MWLKIVSKDKLAYPTQLGEKPLYFMHNSSVPNKLQKKLRNQ